MRAFSFPLGQSGRLSIDPLILRPSQWKSLGLVLICGTFVVLGILMGLSGKWVGYLCAAFFGFGLFAAVTLLLPGASYLRIDADGLTTRTIFRETHIPWNMIEEFFVVEMKQTGFTVHRMVGFNYTPSYDRQKAARRIAHSISGCEGALSDTYGMKAGELADFLNECLFRYHEGLWETDTAPQNDTP